MRSRPLAPERAPAAPVLLLPLALGIALLVSCARRADPASVLSRTYPRVDGSTSTHPLAMVVACRLRGLPYRWETPPGLQRTVVPDESRHPLLAAQVDRNVRHHGTHEAWVALATRRTDLILVAREPSDREKLAARRSGVAFDVRPVARDALVVLAHVANPVDSITVEALRGVYAGTGPSRWSALGGREEEIEPFQREPDSGSQELLLKLVMRDVPVLDPVAVPVVRTMAGVVTRVAMREGGLAYSVYYYVTNMARNPAVKLLAVDGVVPDAASIASGRYPLSEFVYVAVRRGAAGPTLLLRDWLLSAEGQAAVAESGYVPLAPVPREPGRAR